MSRHGVAAAAAREDRVRGQTHQNLELAQLLSGNSINIDKARRLFDAFIPKAPYDIEIYAKVAKKFSFSIDSAKVKSCLPEIFKYSLREFGDYIKAFCECGFYQEHLAEHSEEIRKKTFLLLNEEFNKRRPNANAIIALLIHAKNLGILDENHNRDLRKALILLPSCQMNDTGFSSLLEVSLFCKEVLKIPLPHQLIEYSKSRKIEAQSDSTSGIHLRFVEKLIDYLAHKTFRNGKKREVKEIEKGHYRCGNLEIIVEAKYGKLDDKGREIKSGDVLLILKRPGGLANKYLEIEVDGDKSHSVIIDTRKSVTGGTKSRDKVLQEIFGPNVLVVQEKDFAKFYDQKNAVDFFEKNPQISSIIWEMENDMDPQASAAASAAKYPSPDVPVAKTASADVGKVNIAMTMLDLVAAKLPEATTPLAANAEAEIKKDDEGGEDSKSQIQIKQSDEEILAYYLQVRKKEEEEFRKRSDQYLINLIDRENFDLEEFEQLLLDCKSKIDSAQSADLMGNILAKVIKDKSDNIELFLLLVINCSQDEWNKINKSLEVQVKHKEVLGKIVKRRNLKAVRQDSSRQSNNIETFTCRSSFVENSKNLEKFILDNQDKKYEFSSRWELEYILLDPATNTDSSVQLEELLLEASAANNSEMIRFLVEKKKFTRTKSDEEVTKTLLSNLASYQNLEILRFLYEKGFKFKTNYREDESNPFLAAIASGNLEVARFFVEKLGFKVNNKIHVGKSFLYPIHYACRNNSLEIVKYLVSKGADLSQRDSFECSVLHYALISENPEIYTYLRQECKLNFNLPGMNLEVAQQIFFSKFLVMSFSKDREVVAMKAVRRLIEEEKFSANFFLRSISYQCKKGESKLKPCLIYLIDEKEISIESVKSILEQEQVIKDLKAYKGFASEIIRDCVELGRLDVVKLLYEKLYQNQNEFSQELACRGVDYVTFNQKIILGDVETAKYLVERRIADIKNRPVYSEGLSMNIESEKQKQGKRELEEKTLREIENRVLGEIIFAGEHFINDVIATGKPDLVEYFIGLYKECGCWKAETPKKLLESAKNIKDKEATRQIVTLILKKDDKGLAPVNAEQLSSVVGKGKSDDVSLQRS